MVQRWDAFRNSCRILRDVGPLEALACASALKLYEVRALNSLLILWLVVNMPGSPVIACYLYSRPWMDTTCRRYWEITGIA
jgi:hypothetical protein